MRRLSMLFMLILFIGNMSVFGQYEQDVESIDSILKALYASISGEKGEARDWERFRNLFAEEARLIPTGKNQEGKLVHRMMTPEQYINTSGKWLEENGFHEIEINREVHRFGHVVQVFSTYESKHSKNDAEPFMKGINSIQLFSDGDRWWVLNVYWTQETEENRIPEEFGGAEQK